MSSGALLPELAITGAAIWAPGYASAARLREGVADPAIKAPTAAILPVRLRRRCSLLTRMTAEVIAGAGAAAGIDLSDATIVFASVYGEIQTTGELLAMMVDEPASPLSPTRFHNSVHNTAIGYLSIATTSHSGSTAVSAGPATTAMAMLEAATLVAAGSGPVVVAIAEEPLPEPLAACGGRYAPLAAAFVVEVRGGRGRSALLAHGRVAARSPALPADLAANPVASALALALALDEGSAGRIPLEPVVAGAAAWFLEVAGVGR